MVNIAINLSQSIMSLKKSYFLVLSLTVVEQSILWNGVWNLKIFWQQETCLMTLKSYPTVVHLLYD